MKKVIEPQAKEFAKKTGTKRSVARYLETLAIQDALNAQFKGNIPNDIPENLLSNS